MTLIRCSPPAANPRRRLDDNKIGDPGAIHLAEALEKYPTVTTVGCVCLDVRLAKKGGVRGFERG